MHMKILKRVFYQRQVQLVARELLGMRLIRMIDGKRVGGTIIETEAYDGEQDLACHARSGKTARNQVMYGPGGHAYVYFTYGMHWILNCVAGDAGYPAAALVRAIIPMEGNNSMHERRHNVNFSQWCNGPAKLTKALDITGDLNGADLCSPFSGVFIEENQSIPDDMIKTTPRIGISYAPEPWKSLLWRFVASLDWVNQLNHGIN